ncbi:MAG: NAD(P)-dependent glycerol-3-phosphate dehydrogenase [Lachnospiraceae bacterium]|nr:NAD(P)-dependent glycerol-3-phosphate dehydrogenase [Lachnospiraceae bacterium]
MAKVGVIGAGGWGTALSVLLAHNEHEVTLWSIVDKEVQMLNECREQKEKLPGVKLPESVQVTGNLEASVKGMDLVVLAVPSVYIRSTAASCRPYVEQGQILLNVAKGIEESTLLPMADVIEQEIPQANVAVMSGPTHAEEVGIGMPTTIVVGAKSRKTAAFIQNIFMNERFRVYISSDILGIELGGSLKNVVALAAGIADGLGYGDNTKAALITRGLAEISRLGIAMGGKAETFGGLTGMGDLIVTCASVHSRNRRAGYLIGQGYTYEQAMDEVKMVVEGVYSAKAAIRLGQKYGVRLPIIEEVNAVLFEGRSAPEAVSNLMLRDKRVEYPVVDWE